MSEFAAVGCTVGFSSHSTHALSHISLIHYSSRWSSGDGGGLKDDEPRDREGTQSQGEELIGFVADCASKPLGPVKISVFRRVLCILDDLCPLSGHETALAPIVAD